IWASKPRSNGQRLLTQRRTMSGRRTDQSWRPSNERVPPESGGLYSAGTELIVWVEARFASASSGRQATAGKHTLLPSIPASMMPLCSSGLVTKFSATRFVGGKVKRNDFLTLQCPAPWHAPRQESLVSGTNQGMSVLGFASRLGM